jgi:DnaJ domain
MVDPDPYETLQVTHSASALEIKQAYRNMARKYHPDKYVCCQDEAVKQRASAQFAACAAAYAILSDTKRKDEYDHIYKYGGFDDHDDGATAKQDRFSNGSGTTTEQQTRKRKSTTGIGYSCHDPCTFLWTQGKIQSRRTVAGIQIPSRIQTASDGFRFAFSSGHVITSPSGTTKCISQTTQYFPLGKKKYTTTETVTYHPDGRKEVVITEGDGSESQFSSYQNVSQQKELPWYMNAWNQIQDKLTMCYNPCAMMEAQ